MVQNQLERRLCNKCSRNVFPTRPKPNYILLFISIFSFFIPYLIYYAMKPREYCPICYSKVGMINFNYPPFKGTPESYDPNLISSGYVVRSEESVFEPEGEFIVYIPNQTPPEEIEPKTDQLFCKSCGNKLNLSAKFCPKCGIKA